MSQETRVKIAASKLGKKRPELGAILSAVRTGKSLKITEADRGRRRAQITEINTNPEYRRRFAEQKRLEWAAPNSVYRSDGYKLSRHQALSLALSGERNPNWRDGRSTEPYDFGFNGKTKRLVLTRDAYRCRICHAKGGDCRIAVHHIDEDKANSEADNLITLCYSCHARIHRGSHPCLSYVEGARTYGQFMTGILRYIGLEASGVSQLDSVRAIEV